MHDNNVAAYIYQGGLLKAFKSSKGTVKKIIKKEIVLLSDAAIKGEELRHYDNTGITGLAEHFRLLLSRNLCDIESISGEKQTFSKLRAKQQVFR